MSLGNVNGLYKTRGLVGPWPCSACGELTQYADIGSRINRIFCRNEACDYTRIIDKRNYRIKESDGSVWQFDTDGRKFQVRG